eukprot:6212779-Pleurochrysis_carterae.AAC.1
MSCGDNLEASMASDEGAGTPDERHCNLASLNLSELAGELSLLAHAAEIGEDYDADRMIAVTTTFKREMAQKREWPSAPAATSTAVLPASVMHAIGFASSTPATAADSVATNTLIPAAASATVASFPMSKATPLGDNHLSWPPEAVHVPPPPTPVLDDLRRALRVAR